MMSSITCGRAGRVASQATPSAIAANPTMTTVVRPGLSLVRAIEIAMIGPISPIDPLARMFVPSFVGRMPASPRIGQQCSDRRGGQRDGHESDADRDVGGVEERGDRDAERQRDDPSAHGELDRAALHDLRIDLEAGQEDEEHQAEFGEEVDDVVDLRPAEHVRADDDAAHDLDDHAGQACPSLRDVGDERAERRDRDDQDERPQLLGIHRRSVEIGRPFAVSWSDAAVSWRTST